MKEQRLSNFEILRIIAMFLIVFHHSIVHGVLYELSSKEALLQVKSFVSYGTYTFLAIGGKIGVYIFVLITGYFMYKSHITVKKVVKLMMPVIFWSVILTLAISFIVGDLTVGKFIKALFPITFGEYWFMTTYFFMYFFIPILNITIKNLNSKEEILSIILGMIMVLPGNKLYGGYTNSWLLAFILTYMIGAFIRKHDLLKNDRFIKLNKIMLVICLLGAAITSFVLSYFGFNYNSVLIIKVLQKLLNFTVFCVATATSIFSIIGSKKVKYNKLINNTASAMFGVYLIHDNSSVRPILWHRLFHTEKVLNDPLHGIIYLLVVTVVIVIVCALMEQIRQVIFNKFENKISNIGDESLHRLASKFILK